MVTSYSWNLLIMLLPAKQGSGGGADFESNSFQESLSVRSLDTSNSSYGSCSYSWTRKLLQTTWFTKCPIRLVWSMMCWYNVSTRPSSAACQIGEKEKLLPILGTEWPFKCSNSWEALLIREFTKTPPEMLIYFQLKLAVGLEAVFRNATGWSKETAYCNISLTEPIFFKNAQTQWFLESLYWEVFDLLIFWRIT